MVKPRDVIRSMLVEGDGERLIFCDMDGVLCDFDRQFREVTGDTPDEYQDEYGLEEFWSAIESEGESFWSTMSWMPGGEELWAFIAPHDPIICSTPSQDSKSVSGKLKWIKSNLPEIDRRKPQFKPLNKRGGWDGKSRIVFSARKYAFVMHLDDILIDDREKNVEKWERLGGAVGVLHVSAVETIDALQTLGV